MKECLHKVIERDSDMAKKPPQERMQIRKEKTLPVLKNTIWSKSDSNGIQPDRDRKSEQAGSIQIPCLYFREAVTGRRLRPGAADAMDEIGS